MIDIIDEIDFKKDLEFIDEKEVLQGREDFETPESILNFLDGETEGKDVPRGTSETESDNVPRGTSETESRTVSDDEVGVDLMGAMTMLNFGIAMGSGLLANAFGYDLDTDKILANDAQLKKLAKAGKPLYEKYLQDKMSAETAFLICLVSVYGGKILANIKKKGVSKSKARTKEVEENEDQPEWVGNSDYFQTGKKAGQLKPNAK